MGDVPSELLLLAEQARHGVWWSTGGLGEQARWQVEAVRLVWSEEAAWQAERTKG